MLNECSSSSSSSSRSSRSRSSICYASICFDSISKFVHAAGFAAAEWCLCCLVLCYSIFLCLINGWFCCV